MQRILLSIVYFKARHIIKGLDYCKFRRDELPYGVRGNLSECPYKLLQER